MEVDWEEKTYKDIHIFRECTVRMRFYDFLYRGARVEGLCWHFGWVSVRSPRYFRAVLLSVIVGRGFLCTDLAFVRAVFFCMREGLLVLVCRE
jgi:hypothetical protein